MAPFNPRLLSDGLNRGPRRKSAAEYIDGVRAGNRVVLSQAITLTESTRPEDQELASEVVHACLPHAGNSLRIGITGIPGVGKSTFIESFGKLLLERGHKLSVLAIDPSSERSKGSILGDKTRMEALTREQNAYIRPSPSGGSPGGVARKTRESIILCEAAGFDRILVETVGVGQGETIVHSMVDFFLLLMLPGAGDELQGMKRGIMEMADGIAITKSDSGNDKKAKIAAADYRRALELFPPADHGWKAEVILTSAVTGMGLDEVYSLLENFLDSMKENGHFDKRRKGQAVYWMNEYLGELIRNRILENRESREYRAELKERVIAGTLSPFEAAGMLLDHALKDRS
ncbi:MAG: methylmalonyl Co-A mutase-associated GTPase MeaB [Spirochaetaceae bacterium]|nr:methylmalonyl Co-A mutase-associated GTPase MeaB [Spirochaetaceae bacterium]|tara:strand:+ start:9113 stop:10150 length:1038 start_codon:yes stop_codon:yes gene_type:complete